MDQHALAVDRAVGEYGAMGGDAGDAQARADLVADRIGQGYGLRGRDDDELGRGAERPVGLGAVDPDAFAFALRSDAVAYRVDPPGAVAVRDDAWVGQSGGLPVAALLRVAGVDPRERELDAHLAGRRSRVGHLPDLQHIRGGAPSFVPGSEHSWTLRHPRGYTLLLSTQGNTGAIPSQPPAYRDPRDRATRSA